MLDWRGGLVAAGAFASAGGVAAANIAVWDGRGWSPLGAGFDGPVYALTEYRGEVIAAGDFTHSGATPVRGVARWRGGAWLALDDAGGGVSGGAVRALATWRGALWLGGEFTAVVDHEAAQLSSYIARWRDDDLAGDDLPPRRAPRIVALSGLPTQRISRVTYDLPQAGIVRIALYDIAGRRAHEIAHAFQSPGPHTAEWRADAAGLTSGVYRLVIDADGMQTARAVVVVR